MPWDDEIFINNAKKEKGDIAPVNSAEFDDFITLKEMRGLGVGTFLLMLAFCTAVVENKITYMISYESAGAVFIFCFSFLNVCACKQKNKKNKKMKKKRYQGIT